MIDADAAKVEDAAASPTREKPLPNKFIGAIFVFFSIESNMNVGIALGPLNSVDFAEFFLKNVAGIFFICIYPERV